MAKKLMLQGTSSGAGKTTITLALCRIFSQDGYKVAPFKSQNVTSNTVKTASGDEIAISQLIQAYAARSEPVKEMNPVVLKMSTGGQGTQVILNGKLFDTVSARDLGELKESTLLPEILKGFSMLDSTNDIVVIEGAGSPVELNLIAGDSDIVNMGVATRVGSPVLLIGDIDRGGVFASLYGTIGLFTDTQRALVKGTIVNRFKGDIDRFEDGKEILQRITGVPVAGIVPYLEIDLPEEDELIAGSGNRQQGEVDLGNKDNFDKQIDTVANHIRTNLNMDLIYRILDEQG